MLLLLRKTHLCLAGQLRPIAEDGGPEVDEWNKIMEPYLGVSWLDTPWLYSEFYAYRRVVEAFSFFKTGKGRSRVSRHGVGTNARKEDRIERGGEGGTGGVPKVGVPWGRVGVAQSAISAKKKRLFFFCWSLEHCFFALSYGGL